MPWYYVNDTVKPPEGPFQFRELVEKFQGNEITGDTYVWHRRKVREWKQIKQIKWLEQKLSGVNFRVAQSSRGSVAEIFQEVPQLNNNPNSTTQNSNNKSFESNKRRAVNQRKSVNTNKHRITPRASSTRNRTASAGNQRSMQPRNSHSQIKTHRIK